MRAKTVLAREPPLMSTAATSDSALASRPLGREQSSAASSGPRIEPAVNLDQVLEGVESISTGIDAMLRAAATSAVGGLHPDSSIGQGLVASTLQASAEIQESQAQPSAIIDHEPDEDHMMQFFDEETPSDIHAIDRMLARHAEQLTGDHNLDELPDETEAFARNDPPRRSGRSREDVLAVIGEPGGARQATVDNLDPPKNIMQAEDHQAASMPQDSHAAANDLLAHAHLVAAQGPAWQSNRERHGLSAAANGGESGPSEAACAVATSETRRPRYRVRLGAVVSASVFQTLTMMNLPLHLMPASVRSLVNATAVTLALWAPAVWLLAPVLGERIAKMREVSITPPAHLESAIRGDAGADSTSTPHH
jgi:hypothetical protein